MFIMSLKEIEQAYTRISSYIHKTPIFTNSSIDKLTGRQIFFKAECMQKTGSFKIRGATNAVSRFFLMIMNKTLFTLKKSQN